MMYTYIMSLTRTTPATCSHPKTSQTLLFSAPDYITGDRFEVRRCTACGLARTLPIPASVERYYPAGYYGQSRRYPAPLEGFLDWLYARRARRLSAATGSLPGVALDIGCGRGSLLDHLRRLGWQIIGTELNDAGARHARETLAIDVRTGPHAMRSIPDGSIDLVILWHVLEHVPEPHELLQEANRVLRPGGTMLVAVPNFGSTEAQRGRSAWFHLDVPRHLVHFDLKTLRNMLRTEGFEARRVRFFAPEYDFFSAVQTALNMLGVRQNVLYNLIRTRGAHVFQTGSPFDLTATITTLLLLPVLAVLSLILVPVASLTRRGATLTLVTRKFEIENRST